MELDLDEPAEAAFEIRDDKPASASNRSGLLRRKTLDDDDEEKPPQRMRRSFRESPDDDTDDTDDTDDRRISRNRSRRSRHGRRGSRSGERDLGLFVIFIGLACYGSALAISSLFEFANWVGITTERGLSIIPGIPGLLNWLLIPIGLGILLANRWGSSVANPAILAALAVVGHGVLLYLHHEELRKVSSFEQAFVFGLNNPRDFDEPDRSSSSRARSSSSSRSTIHWQALVTDLRGLAAIPASLLPKGSRVRARNVLLGLCELLRLFLVLLTIRAVADSRKYHRAASNAMGAAIAGAAAVGAGAVLFLLIGLIGESLAPSKGETITPEKIRSAVETAKFLIHCMIFVGIVLTTVLAGAIGWGAWATKDAAT